MGRENIPMVCDFIPMVRGIIPMVCGIIPMVCEEDFWWRFKGF